MRPSRPHLINTWNAGSLSALFFRVIAISALLPLLTVAGFAQVAAPEAVTPTQEDPGYVLHVYTDLLQIPALVLDLHGAPSTHLTAPDFQLQLDGGPVFHPTAIHPEGSEPLTLALVLDGSGAEEDLMNALIKLPGHGMPPNLLPHDHVSVYAFDCTLLRSTVDTAAEIAAAHDGIAHILAAPALHKPGHPNKTCSSSKHVVDSIAVAAAALSREPGRRAILVISDGEDGGSSTSWQTLKDFATGRSIAIFSLRQSDDSSAAASLRSFNNTRGPSLNNQPSGLGVLETLAQQTGGVAMEAQSRQLPAKLNAFITLLRSRYILQFPRPAGGAGTYILDVHVVQRGATVRAAGITFPVRDAALMADPSTVPVDTSKMPVPGTRKTPH